MISMDKKYRTRDGRDVRILCVDAGGIFPVVGIVDFGAITWTSDGLSQPMLSSCSPFDLIEVVEPETRTIWVNVYEGYTHSHDSEEKAKSGRFLWSCNIIATAVPVTFEFTRDAK